ncbi:hypothetical protein [Dactylosporangium sp. NPDC051484]|uniref:hypothetical protein n=1 Tax=Dactylosporangium sp. NPDC051484 TaxID=3154942 RepID=UPI00344E549D
MIQPFFTAVEDCSAAGSAGVMPNFWSFATLRIGGRSSAIGVTRRECFCPISLSFNHRSGSPDALKSAW